MQHVLLVGSLKNLQTLMQVENPLYEIPGTKIVADL